MQVRNWSIRAMGWLTGAAVLMCLMGQTCGIEFPDDFPLWDEDVTVEMVNTTGLEVEPGIYVDSQEGVYAAAELTTEENFLVVEPLIAPGETVTALYTCLDIGTIVSDYAWFFIDYDEYIESEDRPILVRNEDFFCGDVIRFIFDEDSEGNFITEVEILGPPLD